MTQRSTCIPDFLPRDEPRGEPYIGSVPQYDVGSGGRLCEPEKPRRSDGLVPKFGGKQDASTAKMTWQGLADAAAPRSESFQTQWGAVNLAKEQDTWQYMPSVDALNILTSSTGTRLQPLPARFYHR